MSPPMIHLRNELVPPPLIHATLRVVVCTNRGMADFGPTALDEHTCVVCAAQPELPAAPEYALLLDPAVTADHVLAYYEAGVDAIRAGTMTDPWPFLAGIPGLVGFVAISNRFRQVLSRLRDGHVIASMARAATPGEA